MKTEKEIIDFNSELFYYTMYKKLEDEQEMNYSKLESAILKAKENGFKLIEDNSEYGKNEDIFYEAGNVMVFNKNNHYYYIKNVGNRKYCSFNETYFHRILEDSLDSKIITEYQYKLFTNAYFYILKLIKENGIFIKFIEDTLFLQKNFLEIMCKNISFSEQNINILKTKIFSIDFTSNDNFSFNKYNSIANYCGLYSHGYCSWFTVYVDNCYDSDYVESDLISVINYLPIIEESILS